ncbi:RNA-guided endonuclease IscB [Aminobacterium mobile]|uniref:RNA-guided endonuclease IscB n=1 Tax=Aminobacterium mobile TaxID=81467 RepID=UPI003315F120
MNFPKARAVVHKRFPFTIRLKDRVAEKSVGKPVLVKVDPGARFTGIAVVREDEPGKLRLIAGLELEHRGNAIRDNMTKRANYRRRRRSANTRYRAPRFNDRRRPDGWLPPSLRHRVDTTMSWMRRIMRIASVSGFSVESVKFDTQKMLNPEISRKEYQQGELAGYEVREYLLEKWGRKCAYCGAENVPLQVEHIVPRVRGGSNKVSRLTLACQECNQSKGARSIEEFLKGKPELLARIKSRALTPLPSVGAVDSVTVLARDTLRVRCTGRG